MANFRLKRTERADFIYPLQKHITENYGVKGYREVESFIHEIQNARDAIVGIKDNDDPLASLQSFKHYMGYITFLEMRFNFGNKENMIRLNTKWKETQSNNWIENTSITLDKACVIYNISIFHYLAARVKHKCNPKEAIKFYQMAAGNLLYLRDEVKVLGASSDDLSPLLLSSMQNFILAMAQSCIYEKAIQDKLNRSLLSKLAAGVSALYNTAANFASQAGYKDIAFAEIQEAIFKAAAHYQFAMSEKDQVEEESKGYGRLISRLRLASEILSYVKERATNAGFSISVEAIENAIGTWLAQLEKDNKLVYLEIIPAASSLPPLNVLKMAKSITQTLTDISSDIGTDICTQFDKLVPSHIIAKAYEFEAKATNILQEVQNSIDSVLDQKNKVFKERNISPMMAETNQISDNLWEAICNIQCKGGVEFIKHRLNSMEKSSAEMGRRLSHMEEKLKFESAEDRSARERYGATWIPRASNLLNQSYVTQLNTYQAKLEQARKANNRVKESLLKINGVAGYLSLKREEISLPSPVSISDLSPYEVSQIEEWAKNIRTAENNIHKYLEELKTNISDDMNSLPAILISESEKNHTTCVKNILDKYRNSIDIDRELCNISEMLTWIQSKTKVVTRNDAKRDKTVQAIEEACVICSSLFKDIAEGDKFFTSLDIHTRTLDKQLNDWVFARDEERKAYGNRPHYGI